MAFWGCEVKPGKAVPFVPPPEASKLHLSQVGVCSNGLPLLLCTGFGACVADAWEQQGHKPAVHLAVTRRQQHWPTPRLPAARCMRARPNPPLHCSAPSPPRCHHRPAAQACLSTSAKPGAKAALKVKVGEGAALLVCALREGATECAGLDLIFDG